MSVPPATRRRIDWPSAVMTGVTVIALGWVGWQRFGPEPLPEPPAVGTTPPSLRLIDPTTREPLLLPRGGGQVIWVSFWSADSPTASADLMALERVWRRFKTRETFALAALAVDARKPDRFRDALKAAAVSLPAYLADPVTVRAFGVGRGPLPLHILIDEDGRVAAITRGDAAIGPLAEEVARRLERVEPAGKARFAAADGP